jgi:hypothetical protein
MKLDSASGAKHDCKKCVRGNDCPFRKLEQLPIRTQLIPQQAK